MRFCPYCGSELIAEGVSYCAECGKELPAKTGRKKPEKADTEGAPGKGQEGKEPVTEKKTGKKKIQRDKKERVDVPDGEKQAGRDRQGQEAVEKGAAREKDAKILPEKRTGPGQAARPAHPKEQERQERTEDMKEAGQPIRAATDLPERTELSEGSELPERTEPSEKSEPPEGTELSEEPEPLERPSSPGVDDYDGYYDDILPVDEGHDSEGLDGELVKKIILLVIIVLFVIGMCVALMYVA